MRWKDPLGILARQGIGVGMTDAGGDDPHQRLTRLRRGNLDLFDLEGLVGGPAGNTLQVIARSVLSEK